MNCFNIVDSGYGRLTGNQIKNFQQDYMKNHNLTLVCLDSDAVVSLKVAAAGTKNIDIVDRSVEGHRAVESRYGDPDWMKVTSLRLSIISEMVENFGCALHTEADVVWFKDPQEIIEEGGNYDWLMQHDNPHIDNTWLCVGCAYYTSTSNSKRLFREWISHNERFGHIDQESLMHLLDSYVPNELKDFGEHAGYKQACQLMGVKIDTWDRKTVQNGYVAFKENYFSKYSPHAIHANHHVGIEEKIRLLKMCNGWF